MPHDINHHAARRRADASLRATPYPAFCLVRALTPRASAWLLATVGDEANWNDGSLVVEHRYFPGLADAALTPASCSIPTPPGKTEPLR